MKSSVLRTHLWFEVIHPQEPDDVVLVIDSSMGQTARDQAVAFQQAVPVGALMFVAACSWLTILWLC